MTLDLHTHTTYSDGDLDISHNVLKAIEVGLDGIAITDHDTIDSWREIDQKSFPIKVFKGVEVSTYHKGESVHILGYYLNDGGDYQELNDFLIQTQKNRLERLDKIIDLLKPFQIFLTREEIIQEADGAVARPHIARAIMKKYPELGLTKNDIFDLYIGNDAPAYVPVHNFSTEDAIQLLKRNHCLVVLAHPLNIQKFDYRELFDLGIDGIEGFYYYTDKDYSSVVSFGDENGLLVTGGSDYHGPITRDTIGKMYLTGDRCKTFLKKIHYPEK